MKILSIETSCDDTGITIIEAKGSTTNASFKVLADASNSQIPIHIPYGGVYPALAKREHTKNLPILLEACLKEAGMDKTLTKSAIAKNVDLKSPIDAIAVTYGPGLEMCLWEGITFAKDLAKKWSAGRRIPLIPTNHMEGHIMSVFGKNRGKFIIPKVKTPILSLLVSGGHTQLILSKKWMQYEIIGESLDDAVGEAFDKVARMLGLPYPGGPEISKLAERERERASLLLRTFSQRDGARKAIFQQKNMRGEKKQTVSEIKSFPLALPRPMLHSQNFDFSFSGLKTAVLYLIKKISLDGKLDEKTKAQIALEFENAAIECLIYKTAKAIEKYKIKTVIVGGGVSCNKHLQREMKKLIKRKIKLLLPQKELTGDNSLMIGIAGYLQYIKNRKKVPQISNIKATSNLRL
ncbi:hypothetical protein A2814_01320 [Candidatus Nomurabacteria bacterium RIFCSPHIGHO2_01_FULL_38_19]|uniref:tRNA N6-adenosine threonylcarbamoyltransferase n=1 Tax=Candidatus Nomurabacteria bacterium RIFCSPHIGHO2_01_FULL_38_19 TaxID=1801732 RepID=A0A1F6UQP4_9BACT|nr:MAG: hypothetical protein A2814_01320 [Candidatus Nomurabacteria bacterium RIFCSPHIGHO2_01_FULL_38_19]